MGTTLAELTATPTGQKLTAEHNGMVADKRKAAAEGIAEAEATRDAAIETLQKQLSTADRKVKAAEAKCATARRELAGIRGEIGNASARCERTCRPLHEQLAETAAPEIETFLTELAAEADRIRRMEPISIADKTAGERKLDALREAAEQARALRYSDADGADGVAALRRQAKAAYAEADKLLSKERPAEVEANERAHRIEKAIAL